MVAYANSLSTQEVDAGGLLQIQGQPELKSEFQTSLGYSGYALLPIMFGSRIRQ